MKALKLAASFIRRNLEGLTGYTHSPSLTGTEASLPSTCVRSQMHFNKQIIESCPQRSNE